MGNEKRYLFLALGFSLTTFLTTFSASAQSPSTENSWLDIPLVNWNKQSSDFPRLPEPVEATNVEQCRESVREPESDAERALTRRGWQLFGSVESFGTTQLIMATSGFDGMCRPVGYQAFIYVEGRYAGTLSPVLMDSRTDGALSDVRLVSARNISAEFVRYSESDPLCCPSKTSVVNYSVRPDEAPDLVPTEVMTSDNCQTNESENTETNDSMDALFGNRWTLAAIGEDPLNASEAYIEFDSQEQRFFGSSSCNRFAGSFKSSGTTLNLSKIASTRRACLDDETQRIEMELFQSLELVTRFEIEADTLRLYENDRLVLVFRK
ncbi:META domain-containing protein [Candidatus Gracilibacteria bacterium]|nr:META domain-containing protein [Candidatus Gracilibacteria bacterium]NJM89062.1 META domain-containing protein [Hydrococcus sp. RU_2_2]NJP20959.1 META domain-containing protein [Hydrococcus sp. CRU_1_1]